jgi:hypothetical protein
MIVIYRLIFFIMIKISEDVTPWVRGFIARRRLQSKEKIRNGSADIGRTPSLRDYVVEHTPTDDPNSR